MNVASIASASIARSQAQVAESVGIYVLKKSNDQAASNVASLLDGAMEVMQATMEAGKGAAVDTYA